MSQICPSSSHQLVAAAIAFRRARRKFPKNYGLYGNSEDATNVDKNQAESATVNEEANDQENLWFSSRKCSNAAPSRVEAKAAWSDEYAESGSIKESLLQKPIICSCCRKRNEAAKANEPMSIFQTRDQCSAGDTLDVVPSKEHNEIARRSDLSQSEQLQNCDGKAMKSFITEPRNSSRCRASYVHSRRRSPKETSAKLDPINLLYDSGREQVNHVKGSGSPEKRSCNADELSCNAAGRGLKPGHRGSRSKVNFFSSQKDSSSPGIPHNCDFHCQQHSTLDLLRPHRDACRSQNPHRCYHLRNCCHHACDDDYHSCLSKEKPRLASDTCLWPSNSSNQRACNKGHIAGEMLCNHDCCLKDSEKITTVQEQNDEEYDDCVGMINHKDSLCLLVEKYKASKKCRHKKCLRETEFSEERARDECSRSFTSEPGCPMDDNPKQRDKHPDTDNCRPRDNRASIGKSCRHACGQAFREGDCVQLKNLRSRLVKTGACCSAKGTPWRHTF